MLQLIEVARLLHRALQKWESLQLFCYTEPPQYECFTYIAEGVARCTVKMTIPQHPFRAHVTPGL